MLTDTLSDGFNRQGWHAERYEAPHLLQYFPWLEQRVKPPNGTDIIATHSWFGAAYHRRGVPLVIIEHLFTPDSRLRPYRSLYQSVFHETMVRQLVRQSYRKATVTVVVSAFTQRQVEHFSPTTPIRLIYNGTDLEFFRPRDRFPGKRRPGPIRLLYVGNQIARKGFDLLPDIMKLLGDGFQLNYTEGLRTRGSTTHIPNARCLGRLDRGGMRAAYHDADILLFPSRLEGLPLGIIEAAACGVPAVASNISSMPEAVNDGETGILCKPDMPGDFAAAIMELAENPTKLQNFGASARGLAEQRFDARSMVDAYRALFEEVADRPR